MEDDRGIIQKQEADIMYGAKTGKDKNAGNRGKVLIADDSAISADILRNIMESLDFKTEIAKDGKDAVTKYLQSKPYEYCIILMDNMMPSLTGVEATKMIRRCARDDSATTPIVSVSSEMSAENIREYELAGYNGWLCKPVSKKDLEEMLNNCITKSN